MKQVLPISGILNAAGGVLSDKSSRSTKNATNIFIPARMTSPSNYVTSESYNR